VSACVHVCARACLDDVEPDLGGFERVGRARPVRHRVQLALDLSPGADVGSGAPQSRCRCGGPSPCGTAAPGGRARTRTSSCPSAACLLSDHSCAGLLNVPAAHQTHKASPLSNATPAAIYSIASHRRRLSAGERTSAARPAGRRRAPSGAPSTRPGTTDSIATNQHHCGNSGNVLLRRRARLGWRHLGRAAAMGRSR
jgi:hypothetical protein